MFSFLKKLVQKILRGKFNASNNAEDGCCSENESATTQDQGTSEIGVCVKNEIITDSDSGPDEATVSIENTSSCEDECNTDTDTESRFVIKSKAEGSAPLLERIEYGKLLELHPSLHKIAPDEPKKSTLVFTPKVIETITQHIDWDKNTADNKYEQGGIIIGRAYRINEGVVVGIAEAALPAETSSGNPAYLKMDTDTWAKMLDTYDENYKDGGALVIGWYHTHPNSLSVFMSSTDQATQRAFFNQDWHFATVLNPQKRIVGCFISANSTPCSCLPEKLTN